MSIHFLREMRNFSLSNANLQTSLDLVNKSRIKSTYPLNNSLSCESLKISVILPEPLFDKDKDELQKIDWMLFNISIFSNSPKLIVAPSKKKSQTFYKNSSVVETKVETQENLQGYIFIQNQKEITNFLHALCVEAKLKNLDENIEIVELKDQNFFNLKFNVTLPYTNTLIKFPDSYIKRMTFSSIKKITLKIELKVTGSIKKNLIKKLGFKKPIEKYKLGGFYSLF